MKIRWTTPAREQFASVFDYIAEENRRAAAQIAGRIWDSTQLLATHPMLGRPGRVPGTRESVIRGTPFLVAYRVQRREVWILAVMHAAQKWPDGF